MYRPQEQSKHGQSNAYSTKYETKGKSLKIEVLFANITYYKLRAGKHFGCCAFGLGDKGYRVSSTEDRGIAYCFHYLSIYSNITLPDWD